MYFFESNEPLATPGAWVALNLVSLHVFIDSHSGEHETQGYPPPALCEDAVKQA